MTRADDALADLRARVERLEALLQPATPAPDAPADPDATFWLLDQLRQRELDDVVVLAGRVADAAGQPVQWQVTRDAADLRDTDWTTSAASLAALGHPSRLQILQLVARGEAVTAAELARADGLGTTGQIYHHLRQLVGGGWLRTTTRGRHQVPAERLVPLLVVLAAAGGAPT